MLTVSESLRLAMPPETVVLVQGTDSAREVRWVRHLGGRAPALAAFEPGDLILLGLERVGMPADHQSLLRLVSDLADCGVAALVCQGDPPSQMAALAQARDLALLVVPPGTDLAAIERRILTLVVDRESALGSRLGEIHERLVASLLEERGTLPLLETLAAASRKWVLYLDAYLQPVESVGPDHARGLLLAEQLRCSLGERWERADRLLGALSIALADGNRAMLAPLVLRGTPVGALALVGAAGDFTDFDARLAERAAAVLGLEVAKQRAVEAARAQHQREFLADLLSGSFPSEDAMRARARWLGHDLGRPHRVVVLSPDAYTWDDGAGQRQIGLLDSGRLSALADELDALVLPQEGQLVCVAPVRDPGDEAEARTLGDALRRETARLMGDATSVSAGVGRYAPGLRGLTAMYDEARQAVQVAQALLGGRRTVLYAELGATRLLGQLLDSPALAAYFDDHLGALAAHDELHRSELLLTLEAFFAANSNHVRAARTLHLHRNTLLYRLERIRSILGVDLDDPDVRLAVQLALKLRHFVDNERHVPRGPRRADPRRRTAERSAS